MNTKTIMLILAFVASLLSACTTVKVVPRRTTGHYSGGQFHQNGGSTQVDPNRPLGMLKKTTQSGTNTTKGTVHVRLEGDCPQDILTQVGIELKALLEHDFNTNHTWPTKAEAEAAAEELFASKGRPIRPTTVNGQRGGFALTKYYVQDLPGSKNENPETVTEVAVRSEGEIPAGANRHPAMRGPEQFQPRRPANQPADQNQQTPPELP